MSAPDNHRTISLRRLLAVIALVLLPFTLACGQTLPIAPPSAPTEMPNAPGASTGRVAPAKASLPQKEPPQGMVELPSSVGRILTSRMSGSASARKMLVALRIGIEGYFDAPPIITAAFADQADQNIQIAFTATLAGVRVRGLMAIQMRGDTGQGTVIFDRWDAFPQTFTRLAQVVAEKANTSGGPPEVKLTPTQLPDGSGQIGLPPGWRITNSYKGTVDAVGPNGEALGLGGYFAVNSPRAGGRFPNVPTVDFSDLVRAFRDVAAFQRQPITILDSRPIEMQAAGQWAFIRSRTTINGQSYDGLGLYGIMPIDDIQGIFYNSYAVAPSAIFNDALPSMWAAWQSWGVSDAVLRERILSAVSSMRETGDIITGAYWNQQNTYARVNQAWSNYLRDEWLWRDPSDPNTRYQLPNMYLPPDGNMGRMEPVPVQDL